MLSGLAGQFSQHQRILRHDDKAAKASESGWHEKNAVVRDDRARTKLDSKTGMVITEGSFLMLKRTPGRSNGSSTRTYAGQFELIAAYLPDQTKYPGLKTTFVDKAY